MLIKEWRNQIVSLDLHKYSVVQWGKLHQKLLGFKIDTTDSAEIRNNILRHLEAMKGYDTEILVLETNKSFDVDETEVNAMRNKAKSPRDFVNSVNHRYGLTLDSYAFINADNSLCALVIYKALATRRCELYHEKAYE